jgi:hypothetical protein
VIRWLQMQLIYGRFVGRSTHVCCLYIELWKNLICVEAFFL